MPSVLTALAYSVAPTLAVSAGAALIAWRPPGLTLRSVLLHFATGGLIAVVAVELLGDVRARSPLAVALGVLIGTLLMLGLEELGRRLERRRGRASAGVLAVVSVDFALDGLLLGVALHHDSSLGLVLAAALTLEDLVTSMSVAASMAESMSSRRMLRLISAVAAGLPVGALLGGLVGGLLTGPAYTTLLAFAAVALLFLALEQLLRDAHESTERPITTAALFLGLLAFLVLEELI